TSTLSPLPRGGNCESTESLDPTIANPAVSHSPPHVLPLSRASRASSPTASLHPPISAFLRGRRRRTRRACCRRDLRLRPRSAASRPRPRAPLLLRAAARRVPPVASSPAPKTPSPPRAPF